MSRSAAIIFKKNPLEELKDLASGTYRAQLPRHDDTTATRDPSSISDGRRSPTSYQNPTLSPWMLITGAIYENMRHMGAYVIPKGLYVSDELLIQLTKEMKQVFKEEFNGNSIPFMLPSGERVFIPILSARKDRGIILPRHMVRCLN